MASDLIIGPFPPEIHKMVVRICRRSGVKGWPVAGSSSGLFSRLMGRSVSQPADRDEFISALRISALDLFNRYVAGLEGLSGPDAMRKTAFRQVCWWMNSVWLPIEFDPPHEPDPTDGEDMFIGSSVRLLSELEAIRKLSKFDIATLPPGYTEMRNNYRAWFSSPDNDPLSDDNAIRWIWCALHESAQISVEKRVPMSLAP